MPANGRRDLIRRLKLNSQERHRNSLAQKREKYSARNQLKMYGSNKKM